MSSSDAQGQGVEDGKLLGSGGHARSRMGRLDVGGRVSESGVRRKSDRPILWMGNYGSRRRLLRLVFEPRCVECPEVCVNECGPNQ